MIEIEFLNGSAALTETSIFPKISGANIKSHREAFCPIYLGSLEEDDVG